MNTIREAFDRHAATYDHVFSGSDIRSHVWQVADRIFSPGMHVLDLGCGTGDDAIHFARRGVKVSAIDVSPAMIAQLKLKCDRSVQCEAADMQTYSPGAVRFDGVFSNFGALNCVPDLDWVKRLPLVDGAHLVFTTMGRFYPIESAMFLFKGKPHLAFRRFGHPAMALVEGVRCDVYYHTLRSMRRSLGANFKLKETIGIPSLMPIPRVLKSLDRYLCSSRLMAPYSDHFLSVWKYRAT